MQPYHPEPFVGSRDDWRCSSESSHFDCDLGWDFHGFSSSWMCWIPPVFCWMFGSFKGWIPPFPCWKTYQRSSIAVLSTKTVATAISLWAEKCRGYKRNVGGPKFTIGTHGQRTRNKCEGFIEIYAYPCIPLYTCPKKWAYSTNYEELKRCIRTLHHISTVFFHTCPPNYPTQHDSNPRSTYIGHVWPCYVIVNVSTDVSLCLQPEGETFRLHHAGAGRSLNVYYVDTTAARHRWGELRAESWWWICEGLDFGLPVDVL